MAKQNAATQTKPNILVIWGDDIGISNLSCYSDGVMGYRTPNIDRIAKEGMRFTDSYGEQSCTAGRASFITGQSGYRTGLTKVGIPASPVGLKAEDPTIAELLKPLGYATGQFGKNHLGDRNEYLPTAHGFDEFFGNLYHLNAEEEPELPDYPSEKDFPNFRKQFGPRGVIHSWATGKDDQTVDPRFGKVGRQKVEDTGPLTKKRMETCDDEFVTAAKDFIKRQHADGQPFFCWVNTTHMHLRTHTKPKSIGQAGRWQSPYHDTMIDHDKNVGELLNLIDELGIADNTFVMYSTDNGPHMNTWPDGAMTPFRSEKNTNWEGAEKFYSYFVDELNITDFQVNTSFSGGEINDAKRESILDMDGLSRFFVDLVEVWVGRGYDQGVKIGPLDELMNHFIGEGGCLPCIWRQNCADEFVSIDARGYVAQCDCWVTSYPDYWFGNIFEANSFTELLQQSQARKRFEARPEALMQHETCVECDYLSICHGGCPVRTYSITGDFFVKDPYCQVYKSLFSCLEEKAAQVASKRYRRALPVLRARS